MLNLENLLPVGRKVDRCVIVIRYKMFLLKSGHVLSYLWSKKFFMRVDVKI